MTPGFFIRAITVSTHLSPAYPLPLFNKETANNNTNDGDDDDDDMITNDTEATCDDDEQTTYLVHVCWLAVLQTAFLNGERGLGCGTMHFSYLPLTGGF